MPTLDFSSDRNTLRESEEKWVRKGTRLYKIDKIEG